MASSHLTSLVDAIHHAAVRIARVMVIALIAVCGLLALGLVARLAAPQALAPLWNLPTVSETLFGFLLYAPMLAGMALAWGLLAVGRRVWRRHRVLAWPIGVIVFTALMDVLPARTWQNSIPLGDRVPGTPDGTLLERMGEMLPATFAGGLVAATLWWLLLGTEARHERSGSSGDHRASLRA